MALVSPSVIEQNVPGVPFAGPMPPLFDTSYMDMSAASAISLGLQAAGGAATSEQLWVQRQLGAYEREYIQMCGCTATFVTFNVGCKRPPNDLLFVLGSGVTSPRDRAAPDLVVVGLQEVDMSAAAMLREETEAAAPWIQSIVTSLEIAAEDPAYRLIAKRQLVGLMIMVCVKSSSASLVKDVRVATIATGALGTVGNKGAIGCRLTYRLSTMSFVVCHLAAHQNAVGKRNQDIAQILSALNLAEVDPTGNSSNVSLPTSHDLCFVLGDLNYRIDTTYEAACDLAAKGDIKSLLKDDQLIKELGQLHTPWKGFTEFTPTFLPTYRYDIGTDRYDTSEKKRIPSYTDRILWKARDDLHSQIELVTLDAVMDVRSSDHKPVVARVNIPIKEEDPTKKHEVYERLTSMVTSLGLSRVSAASVSCSVAAIEFPAMTYLSRSKATLELTNTGNCVAEIHFARRCADDVSDGAWLRLLPSCKVTVLPGKKVSCDVYAVVDWLSLRWAVEHLPYQSRQSRRLSSFLMVCVVDGPAIAVQCSAEIIFGCMGTTLDVLVGAGLLPCAEAFGAPPSAVPPAPMVPVIPKELWYLVDALSRGSAPKTPDLFDGAADAEEVHRVIHHINTVNLPLDLAGLGVSPEAVASTLMLLLRDLQFAVIAPTHHAAAIQAGKLSSGPAIMSVVKGLPVNHHNALLYLISFGRFLLRSDNSDPSGLTADGLAATWAPILFALSPAGRPLVSAPTLTDTANTLVSQASTSSALHSPQPSQVSGAGSSGVAVPSGKEALTLRQEMEAETEAAGKFLLILLAGRPEMLPS